MMQQRTLLTEATSEPTGITLVKDLTTGCIDGTVTKGGLILVTGKNIQLCSEHETEDAILLVNQQGEVTTVTLPLEKNSAEQLIFSIPLTVEAGEYIFQIRKTFLKEKEQPSFVTIALPYLLKLVVQIPCMAFIICSPNPMV